VVVKVEQIVMEYEVISLLTNDEDDPEDGNPTANHAPAPMDQTVASPLKSVVKIKTWICAS